MFCLKIRGLGRNRNFTPTSVRIHFTWHAKYTEIRISFKYFDLSILWNTKKIYIKCSRGDSDRSQKFKKFYFTKRLRGKCVQYSSTVLTIKEIILEFTATERLDCCKVKTVLQCISKAVFHFMPCTFVFIGPGWITLNLMPYLPHSAARDLKIH